MKKILFILIICMIANLANAQTSDWLRKEPFNPATAKDIDSAEYFKYADWKKLQDAFPLWTGKCLLNITMFHDVKIGMNEDMCEAALGQPLKVNTTETANIKHEQWVFESKNPVDNPVKYLYFENGILTSIQREN